MRRMFLVMISAACMVVMTHASRAADSWDRVVPKEQRLDFGYAPNEFQTTFWELNPGRLAPINTKTAVAVPGWPVSGFGYLMRNRYSEFEIRFQSPDDRYIHTLPNFKQVSPGGWYPGAQSHWDKNGVHHTVTYIAVPNEPQPVELYRISLRNTSSAPAKGNLVVMLDGAPTLKADGDLISDRGKPLIVMDPPVPSERIVRDAGCVDSRTTAGGTTGAGSPMVDKWRTHRVGWYGMPVEYLLKAAPGETLQVYLGFDKDPIYSEVCWDLPDDYKIPKGITELYEDPGQEVLARVEGDVSAQQRKVGYRRDRCVLKFAGKDTDGDGYIKVSVQATPQSRQPAILAMIWAFDEAAQVTTEELIGDQTRITATRTSNEMYAQKSGPATGPEKQARYVIDVGDDLPWDINREWQHIGSDPTVFGLKLDYRVSLAPGEERVYYLRLPTIDKPEIAPYGWPWRPYDTGETWRPTLEPYHPENKSAYGQDLPVGTDPAQFGAFGPKPRELWDKQLAAARSLTWEKAMARLTGYWDGFVAKRTKFITPEPYLDDIYKHQLAVLDMCRLRLAPTNYEIQLTGPDWYWDIAVSRDTPYMHLVWDQAGYSDVADSMWRLFLTPRSKLPRARWTVGQWEGGPETDGLWIARPRQWSGQGQFLWSLVSHHLLRGDAKGLSEDYPKIRRAAEWTVRAIEREKKFIGDPNAMGYGMLPPCGPEDGGPGHNYYSNAYNVMGLDWASKAAGILGKKEDAARWTKQARELQVALRRNMDLGYFRLNDFAGIFGIAAGWFPGPDYVEQKNGKLTCKVPAEKIVDTSYGCPLVWPTRAVSPFDPIMQGWFRYREHMAESTAGIYSAYGPSIAADQGLSYIFRGEPDRAADQFYTYVNHFCGTLDFGEGVDLDAVFTEFDPPKKGIRTGGQMPHAWSSTMYIHFLRNLMILEDGNDLRIAPGIPRKWLAQPKPIGVEKAPTLFGPVTYRLVADPDQTTIRGDIKLDPKRKPAKLLINVRGPGGRGLSSVKINGKKWDAFAGDMIIVINPPTNIKLEATCRQ